MSMNNTPSAERVHIGNIRAQECREIQCDQCHDRAGSGDCIRCKGNDH